MTLVKKLQGIQVSKGSGWLNAIISHIDPWYIWLFLVCWFAVGLKPHHNYPKGIVWRAITSNQNAELQSSDLRPYSPKTSKQCQTQKSRTTFAHTWKSKCCFSAPSIPSQPFSMYFFFFKSAVSLPTSHTLFNFPARLICKCQFTQNPHPFDIL